MRGFRVYDTFLKKYVTNESCWVITPDGELGEMCYGDLIGRPSYIKESYTGLTDKNGTKIFEGDIVLLGVDRETSHYVYWQKETSSFILLPTFGIDNSKPFRSYEVIGNIHDDQSY